MPPTLEDDSMELNIGDREPEEELQDSTARQASATILRTQSLDDAHLHRGSSKMGSSAKARYYMRPPTVANRQHSDDSSFDVSPSNLHTSFDGSFLRPPTTSGLMIPPPPLPPPLAGLTPRNLHSATSWDEHGVVFRSLPSDTLCMELLPDDEGSNNPLLQQQTPMRPRANSLHRQGTTVKKALPVKASTPASVKRRRAGDVASAAAAATISTPLGVIMPPKTPRDNIFLPPTLDQHDVPVMPLFGITDNDVVATVKKARGNLNATHDTDNDSLDMSDHDNNSTSAPFCFPSFPASLPRIPHAANAVSAPWSSSSHQRLPPATAARKRRPPPPLHRSLQDHYQGGSNNNTSISTMGDEEDSDEDMLRKGPLPLDDDDDSVDENVPRARLNFNAAVLARDGKTAHEHDPPTTLSSYHRPLYEQLNSSPLACVAAQQPGSSSSSALADHGDGNSGTPPQVQLHFALDESAPCSPILGTLAEEYHHRSTSTTLRSRTSYKKRSSNNTSTCSCGDSTKSSASSSRPMPDMAAFDMDSRDNSSLHHAGAPSVFSATTAAPKLQCPPTPVRTPSWAHHGKKLDPSTMSTKPVAHSKLQRANSLVATKVLATYSPHTIQTSLSEDDTDRHAMHPLLSRAMTDAWTKTQPKKQPPLQPRVSVEHTHEIHHEAPPVESMAASFDTLGVLGSGTFADVYKVRSKADGKLYAVKKARRQFRGRRDRDKALAEVQHMQKLQLVSDNGCSEQHDETQHHYGLYLLFFYQAWQEDGYFFCQTELCCKHNCQELMDSLRSNWDDARKRYASVAALRPAATQPTPGCHAPNSTVWKLCHDVAAGLSHIHSHGLVHHDIKPSNIFFVEHATLGTVCKIGDFGLAAAVGSSEDGQEGDQKYMAPELLASDVKHSSSDLFSLGLMLYQLASNLEFEVPSEGKLWHNLRENSHHFVLPDCRGADLKRVLPALMHSEEARRPTASALLDLPIVAAAMSDPFLKKYVHDVNVEADAGSESSQEQTPRLPPRARVCSPTLSHLRGIAPPL